MARYFSVRGWLETDHDHVEQFIAITQEYLYKYDKYFSNRETNQLYQKGWRFPTERLFWGAYIFYGADVKLGFVDYIKDQILEMCKYDEELNGYFKVTSEDDLEIITWKIEDGQLKEIKCPDTQ